MKDPIAQLGDPVLRQKALPVPPQEVTSRKIKAVITTMKRALAKEDFGVAIAAPQVGESLRMFIVAGKAFEKEATEPGTPTKNHSPKKSSGLPVAREQAAGKPGQTFSQNDSSPERVFINPVLSRLSKAVAEMSEGCLSVRGKYGTVIRHEKATVKALDEHGKPFTYQGSGLIAHIFQHECDHLDGILYIDKAVKLEEDEDLASARKKLKEKHGV